MAGYPNAEIIMGTGSAVIREARPEDAPALSRLLDDFGFPASAESIVDRLRALAQSNESVLVAQEGNEVIGFATVHVMPVLHRPTPVGRISAIMVAEDRRGRGVGCALMAAAERAASSRGCALMEVTSNRALTAAHAFYEHLGYEISSFRFRKVIEDYR